MSTAIKRNLEEIVMLINDFDDENAKKPKLSALVEPFINRVIEKMKQQENEIAAKENAIADKDREIAMKNRQLEEKDREIEELKNDDFKQHQYAVISYEWCICNHRSPSPTIGVTKTPKTQVKIFEFLNKSAFIRFIFVVIVIRYKESYIV